MTETKNGPTDPPILQVEQSHPVADAVLRKINHREWLEQFAMVLGLRAPDGQGPPMTPMRAGAISRLKLVIQYIDLLERENRDYLRETTVQQKEIETLRSHLRLWSDERR